ncbi:hypothetical protein ILUMI_17410, partial [Ignelater luminosus]
MFASAANDYGATTSNMIKTSKSRRSIVESLMNPKKLSNPYVNYGIEKEPLAKIQFERMYSKEIDAIIQGKDAIIQ